MHFCIIFMLNTLNLTFISQEGMINNSPLPFKSSAVSHPMSDVWCHQPLDDHRCDRRDRQEISAEDFTKWTILSYETF